MVWEPQNCVSVFFQMKGDLPVHLCSNPNLWSQGIGSDRKNEITDTICQNEFPLQRGWAQTQRWGMDIGRSFHLEETVELVQASDQDPPFWGFPGTSNLKETLGQTQNPLILSYLQCSASKLFVTEGIDDHYHETILILLDFMLRGQFVILSSTDTGHRRDRKLWQQQENTCLQIVKFVIFCLAT